MNDFLDKADEMIDKPIVQKAFTEIGKWFGGILTKNKKMKEELAKAKENGNNLVAIKANLEFMEKWNTELEQELKDKEKMLDELAKRTTDLSGAEILQSVVSSSFGDIQGGLNIGDNQRHSSNDTSLNFEIVLDAIEDLKMGYVVEKVQTRYPAIPKEIISRISEILTQK